jgi:hypothetical protein
MKKILILSLIAFGLFLHTSVVDAATHVSGYFKKNGTYVNSYYRSDKNSVKYDNYSAKGNYNPYTGKKGYKGW